MSRQCTVGTVQTDPLRQPGLGDPCQWPRLPSGVPPTVPGPRPWAVPPASPPCPQTRRSAFQCLQKYQQHNAALKRREWTQEEDRMLTQLVQAMGVGSHIPYRRSESWGSSRAAREPVAWGRLTRRGLCLQSPTTWRGGTPRSSSTAGPKAWTPP